MASEYRIWTPRWLGITDLVLVQHSRNALLDMVKHRPVDILIGSDAEHLKSWIEQNMSTAELEAVIIKPIPVYRSVCKKALPSSLLLVDMKDSTALVSEAIIKGVHDIFPAMPMRAAQKFIGILAATNTELAEQDEKFLRASTHVYLEMSMLHDLLQLFRRIGDCSDRASTFTAISEFSAAFADAPKALKRILGLLASFLEDWAEEVANYSDFKTHWLGANQPVEGLLKGLQGELVDRVKSMHRGYSFEVIRAYLLLG